MRSDTKSHVPCDFNGANCPEHTDPDGQAVGQRLPRPGDGAGGIGVPAEKCRVSFGGEKNVLNLTAMVVAQLRMSGKPLNWML